MVKESAAPIQQNGKRPLNQAWGMLEGSRSLALLQAIIAFFEGFAEAAILTIFARTALVAVESEDRRVYVPALGPSSVRLAMLFLIALILGRVLAGIFNNWLSAKIQYRLVRELRTQVVSAYTSTTWAAQARLEDGALQQLVVTLPNGIGGQLSGLIHNFGQFSIMLAMISYALLTDSLLTLVLVCAIVGATFLFRPLRNWIKRRSAEALDQQRLLSSLTAEVSALKLEANSFGIGGLLAAPLEVAVVRESNLQERVSRLKGVIIPLYTLITYSAVTGGILLLLTAEPGNLAQTGPILLVVLRSLSYGATLQQAFSGLASLAPSLEMHRDEIDRFKEEKSKESYGQQSIETFRNIEFRNVSFWYSGNDEDRAAIKDASFSIEAGTKVGIVGPSGSGKSTIVKLILGLVTPSEGQVLVNGKPLSVYSRAEWTSRMGFVPQAATVIRGSIAENLRLYREDISDEDLWFALEIADFADEVERLPQGLETRLGPGFRQLSGGQQQRLAIARAFARRPALVIMDEPSSAIDPDSESQVSDAIDCLPRTTTVVIVSHRPRILEGCDQIISVDSSKVIGVRR